MSELEKLLNKVEEAVNSWSWFPQDEFGTSEAIVPSECMIELDRAYQEYIEQNQDRLTRH